jgi:Mg2+ and Co2+ transporter CorA
LEKDDEDESMGTGGLDQLNIVLFKNYVITIHKNPVDGFENVLKEIELYHEIELSEFESMENMESNQFEEFIENAKSSKYTALQFDKPVEKKLIIEPRPSIDESNPSTRKWTKIPSPDWILYSLLDSMVDTYVPIVDILTNEVESCGEKVFSIFDRDREEFLQQLGAARRKGTKLLIKIIGSEMRRVLAPKRFILNEFIFKRKIASYIVSKDFNLISKDIQAYFRDILDHLTSALEKIEYSRDSLSQTVFFIFSHKSIPIILQRFPLKYQNQAQGLINL